MLILQAPNWELPFKLMCNAFNPTLGAILGQRVGKQSHGPKMSVFGIIWCLRIKENLDGLGPSRVPAQAELILADSTVHSQLGVVSCTIHVGNPAQCHCSSEPTQLPCHSREAYNTSYARRRSWTERPKVVRGDHLTCHRTLVDLILSALANRGEPSPANHGDHLGRWTHRIHTFSDPMYDLDPEIEINLHRVRKARNIVMENNNDRTLKELATPDMVYQPWCIQYPQLEPA
ncbi:hypothetical protein CR513_34943, partial [Mucuna pruriens]